MRCLANLVQILGILSVRSSGVSVRVLLSSGQQYLEYLWNTNHDSLLGMDSPGLAYL